MAWVGNRGEPLPEAGDAFLIRIGPRQFTFCWVAGHGGQAQRVDRGKLVAYDQIVVACARWRGTEPPTSAALRAPEVLQITFEGSPRPLVHIATEAPPRKLRPLGRVERAAIAFVPEHHGAWYWMERGARGQAAWDADSTGESARRAAAHDAQLARMAENNAARDARAAEREAQLRARTPIAWARARDLLAELDGAMPRKRADELRGIVRTAARALAKLPSGTKRAAKLAILERAVVAINEWNAAAGAGVIETGEREILCDVIDRIGRASGLRGRGFAEPWRDF